MGKFQMDSTLVCQKCGRSTLVKYATHWLNEPHKIYTGYRVVRCPEHWTEWAMRNTSTGRTKKMRKRAADARQQPAPTIPPFLEPFSTLDRKKKGRRR